MYRKQISQKASPSLRITPTNQDVAPSPSYGSLSSVVQRAQQDPDTVSGDERQQLESAIGTRSTREILAGKQTPWAPEFHGISSQLWGDAGQVGVPIQAKGKNDVGASEMQPENQTGLPDNLKTGIENLSGMAMDDVSVHYNSSKPAQIQALAYTQGTEIHVAPGQEKHLPHEAWHVVQQKQGRVKPTLQMKGVGINDDGELEREADLMGANFSGMKGHTDSHADELNQSIHTKTFRMGQKLIAHDLTHLEQPNSDSASLLSAQSTSPAPSIIQPKLKIGDIEYSNPKTIRKRAKEQGVDESIFDALVALGQANTLYTFSNWETASALAPGKQRKAWWKSEDTDGIWDLHPKDTLFQQIAQECVKNHDKNPYSTDALHETGPIMEGWMKSKGFKQTMYNVVPALFTTKTILGKNVDDRPDIEITRIQMIKNKALLKDYQKAKQEIQKTNSGNANERSLYSGHGISGMDYITKQGHAPDYGTYDPSAKGHGAHGRGAYFTDQVDKAISYSSKEQGVTEERSFFKQDVLLGKTHEYTERGLYRHRHHNEMVNSTRNQRNKNIVEGIAGKGLEGYDSLKGKKTYEPGAGILGTINHRKEFDSDEYMVRNADQIYVKFRIFYKLK
jgi:Poly(ADP-ribose) polymerase catalytic domain/Domain of unknown function (DUF4157)